MTEAIHVGNLRHAYQSGQVALAGVTLSVATGERVAVLGANGAGKSTLFLRLAGVLAGTPGVARVHGLDPAVPAERAKLPGVVGVLFQNPDDQLFAGTVGDDALFGPLNLGMPLAEAEVAARAALERVGLAGYWDRAPLGLSGGEKRRAALAGVLAMDPAILLLDEPTAYLDARGKRALAEFLLSWPGTLLVGTHDLEFAAKLCTRAVVLDAGRVVADGPAAAILGDGELLAKFGLVA